MLQLDAAGEALLRLLIQHFPKVGPGKPDTYLGYKEIHTFLGLPQTRETWGESLKAQGLSNLADWTEEQGLPAITGLIISTVDYMPGIGYFKLFGMSEPDFDWWKNEIQKSLDYDWSPFLKQKENHKTPSEVLNDSAPELHNEAGDRIFLVKLGRDSVPGGNVNPTTADEWQGAFSCNGRKYAIYPDGTTAPDPIDGDNVYIWIHESEKHLGRGFTAKAIIKHPKRSGSEFQFELSDVELQFRSFEIRETDNSYGVVTAMHRYRHNCIWCLTKSDVKEFHREIEIAAKEGIAVTHSREHDYNPETDHTLEDLVPTEKEALVKSRIGQGIFRQSLINDWQGCAVTGATNEAILRASHIKPWSESSNIERLDPFNGLLLTPALDLAFDRHLISFDSAGKIMISQRLSEFDCSSLGFDKHMKLRNFHKNHESYMSVHRNRFRAKEKELSVR